MTLENNLCDYKMQLNAFWLQKQKVDLQTSWYY